MPISEAADDLRGLRLSEQETAMYLDLGPYANPSYYVVQVCWGQGGHIYQSSGWLGACFWR